MRRSERHHQRDRKEKKDWIGGKIRRRAKRHQGYKEENEEKG